MRYNLITSLFLFVWACVQGSGIFLFLLPSCLATASPIVLSPWHILYAVRGLLAANHAVLLLLVVGSLR